MAKARSNRPFVYGWLIVVVSFAVILIGAGTRSAPGALLLGMEADTGWSKAEISLAAVAGVIRDTAGDYAIAYFAAGFMAIAAGVVALMLRRVSPSATPVPAPAG